MLDATTGDGPDEVPEDERLRDGDELAGEAPDETAPDPGPDDATEDAAAEAVDEPEPAAEAETAVLDAPSTEAPAETVVMDAARSGDGAEVPVGAPEESPADAGDDTATADAGEAAVEAPLPDFLTAPLQPLAPPAPPEQPAEVDARRMRVPSLRVLVLPRSTFRRLPEGRKAWAGALALVTVTALAKAALAFGFAFRTPPGDRMLFSLGLRYGLGVLGPILFALAAAGLLRLAQRWWRGEASFGLLFSAVSLALVPLAVRNAAQAVYIAVTREALLHPGLSAIVAPVTRSPLRTLAYSALSTVDLFTLWSFVLLFMAVTVSRGRGWARGAFVTLLLALLGAAALAGASAGVSILLAR